ncbi:MAG: hypothetical protein KDB53_08315, partial [Planctomycetes bacterium]|nr:hypothetical protein [Planctomycetota bacterium]
MRSTVGAFICAVVLLGGTRGLQAQGDLEKLAEKVARLESELYKSRADRETDRAEIESLRNRLEDVGDAGNASRLETLVNGVIQDDELPISTRGSRFGELVQSLVFYGEARARFLYSNNIVTLDDSIDDEGPYGDGRFRLGMIFSFSESVRVVFDMQAVGRFNNNAALEAMVAVGNEVADPLDNVGLHQAYLELADLFNGGADTFIRAGRQELVYGNSFILGSDEFFAGLAHDSFRVDADLGAWRPSFFYAIEADARDFATSTINGLGPSPSKDHEWMVGLYNTFEFEALDPVAFDFYWVFFESRDDTTFGPATFGTNFLSERTVPELIFGRFHTIGLRIHAGDIALRDGLYFSQDNFWASGEIAIQTGEGGRNVRGFTGAGAPTIVAFQQDDYTAFAGELFFSYRFDGDWRFTLHGGFRWAEGGGSNEVGFSPLFVGTHGTWASRFGNMDMFPLSNTVLWKFGFTLWPSEVVQVGATLIGGYLDNEEYDFYQDND